jgi:hypothetical protein
MKDWWALDGPFRLVGPKRDWAGMSVTSWIDKRVWVGFNLG